MIRQASGWLTSAVLALAAALWFSSPAAAGFREDIAADLGAKTATLVAPAGSEWLIDLDAASAVQVGDLFAVVGKGAPVVHPVTKKVIGSIDETRAVLRVTKVKTGYSYAAVLTAAAGELKPGNEARRFAGLPALFWDYAGSGEEVFTQLQGALPELNWQGYAAAQAARPEQPRPVPGMEPGLVFVFNAQGLGVKDHTFQPLRFYRPERFSQGATSAAAAPAAGSVSGGTVAVVSPPPTGGGIVAAGSPSTGAIPGGSSPGWLPKMFGGGAPQPGPGGALAGSGPGTRGGLIVSQMDSKEGVWYGPRMEGQPVGVEVGDLDGDGKHEVALGFRDRVVVARVNAGKFEPLADYAFGNSGDALSLDGLDLDGNGRMELYVSLAQVGDVRSLAVELQGNQLVEVVRQTPWFVRKVRLSGEGYVLLGQELNPDLKNHNQDLAGPVFRVTRNGDRLERGAPLDLPQAVSLHGFLPFDHESRPLLARLSNSDKLQVLEPGGGILWESSDYFGGSESSFERSTGLNDGSTRYAFVSPRLEPGPEGTILVPVNEGSRTFSAFRAFNNSHLKAVAFDGYALVERWRTKPQGGYLGDFRMADADNDGAQEIVMLVMFSRGGGLMKSGYGNTALLIYEMQ